MSISLVGKRLEDIVEIPIEIGGKRLSFPPNRDDEVYVFEGDKIHYSILSKEDSLFGMKIMLEAGSQDIFDGYQLDEEMVPIGEEFGHALVGKAEYHFRGPKGKKQSFSYYQIEVWEEIPASIRDVAFYHTFHKTKILEKDRDLIKAHNLSSIKTKIYVKKYLSDYEKKEHSDLIENLKVLRGFNE